MIAVATPSISHATSSGWLHPTEMERFSKQMSGKMMMPVKIACRGDSSKSSVRDSMELNLTFAPNPANLRWRWVWGSTYSSTKFQLEKAGWKAVSTSGFTRPTTGLRVPCGIFHRK